MVTLYTVHNGMYFMINRRQSYKLAKRILSPACSTDLGNLNASF